MHRSQATPLWAEYINGWLDSLKAAGYSTATLHTRRCQMTAMGNALGGSPLDVGGNADWSDTSPPRNGNQKRGRARVTLR